MHETTTATPPASRTSRERVSVRRSPAVRTVHGSPGMLLGLAGLLATAGAALMIGLFRFGGGDGDLAPVIGIFFLVIAAVFAWNGLSGAAQAGIRSETPWRADGFTTPVLRDGVGHSHGKMALLAAIAVGFAIYLVPRASGSPLNKPVGYAFFALGAGFLLYILWTQLRRWKFGRRKLVVRKLPTRPGEAIELIFRGGSRLGEADIDLCLQCVEQEHRIHYAREHGPDNSVASFRVYQEERRTATDAQGDAPLAFTIPPDLPGNRLRVGSNEKVVYWRLVVRADLPGLDYEGEFLLPVYDH